MTRAEDFSLAMRPFLAAPPQFEPREGELDLTGAFRIVRRRIWLIAGVFMLLSLAALLPILLFLPVYSAQSRVLIQSAPVAAFAGPDRPGASPLNLPTEVERLRSRDVAAKVIQTLHLDERAEFNPALRQPSTVNRIRASILKVVRDMTGYGGQPQDDNNRLDPVIRSFFEALRVATVPASNVIEIGFEAHDPKLAAAVPNTLLRVYLETRENDRSLRTAAADRWLAQRVREQEARLADAEQAVEAFGKAGGLASRELLAGNLKMIPDLNARQADLARSRGDLVAATTALGNAASPEDRIAMVDTPAGTELARELQLRRHELSRLLDVYGDSARPVVEARAKVEATSAAVGIEIARYKQTIGARTDAIDREDAAIRASLETAGAAVVGQERAAAQGRELEKTVSDEMAALAALTEQRRALAAQSELPAADIEVLSPATEPPYPTGRGRAFYLALAMGAAVLAGLTSAVLVEMLDDTVRSPRQLRRVLGGTPGALVRRLPGRIARKLPRILARRRDSAIADAVRGIVVGLEQANGGRFPASVLVTSPLAGEGKSMLAAALAVELAASRPVLLVDCDLHRGRLHALFGGLADAGLGDVLHGTAALADVVRIDKTSGVAYVARGRHRDKPLDQPCLASILSYAKAQHRIVVFDSPPALSSVVASFIANAVDATLLVLRWGRTSQRSAETAIERLRSGETKPIVTVVNMVNPRRHALYGFSDPSACSFRSQRYMPRP